LKAVSHGFLEHLAPDLPHDQPWPDQLACWEIASRRLFLRLPALFRLIGWRLHISSACLQQLATLARILRQAGYEKKALARTVLWTSRVIVGVIFNEIASRHAGTKLNPADLDGMPDEDAALLKSLLPDLNESANKSFEIVIKSVVAALQQPDIFA
jgi:hypothetical protein